MASARLGRRGGKRENSGRKRKYSSDMSSQQGWNSQHKRIYLSLKIFEAWRDAKTEAYNLSSDSDFAAHLLSLEYRRREDFNQKERVKLCIKGSENSESLMFSESEKHVEALTGSTSTPLKSRDVPTMDLSTISPILGEQLEEQGYMEFDVSHHDSSTAGPDISNVSVFTDDEAESSGDCSSSDEEINLHNLTNSVIEELNAGQNIVERQSDIDITDDDSETDFDSDIYEMDDENDDDVTDQPEELQPVDTFSIPFGPHGKLTRGQELYSMKDEYKVVQEKKFICSLDLLLELLQLRCHIPGCQAKPSIQYHFVGVTLVVNCVCLSGHNYRFCSSQKLNDIYANNLQTAASIQLSGNNFSKIERMARFLNLEFISSSTYYRFQRVYLLPEVNDWWSWTRKEVLAEFFGKEIVVGGDGQCDSPGFNAKNLCYFIVEESTNLILDIEVLDKRHVGLVSTNMEKEAVNRCLDRLSMDVKISELVTDASTSVKALLERKYKDVVHSLDVWHKSKSIKKCLTKLGKPKAMSKIKDWSASIIRHFWYCSSSCRVDESTSDEDALKRMKDKWIGLLHHICNKHNWLGGKCDHEEGEHDESLPWFDRRDPDFEALQKIILNPELLDSFKYYTRFRHTGGIECANSLGLVYTPKRTPFSYRAYKARRQLAAIDWNFHLNREQAVSQSGEKLVTRKYNPRTRQWDVKIIKVNKGYEYIPVLITKILRRREVDTEGVTQVVALNTSDPALIARTTAHVPPPPTKEIANRKSRFSK